MTAVEFTTNLSGADTLRVPTDIAAQLPHSGKARVIILTEDENESETTRECLRRSAELGAGVVQEISHEEVMREARLLR